ncbi:MAG: phospholipase D family protein [Bryobacteraceae bacterium]
MAKPKEAFAPGDLFSDQVASGPLTVFQAELTGQEHTDWQTLFRGFDCLKAITFSSSIEFLVQLAPQFTDMEIVFGSERILLREHLALAQASQTIESYTFPDALADQKVLTEALASYLGKHGEKLLSRVLDGSLRFRLLRKRPSHEKLYLLTGPAGHRVVTGSANLSAMAFEGRQREVYVSFTGQNAWIVFDEYYQRDSDESAPIDADLLVTPRQDSGEAAARTAPIELNDVPIARIIKAGAVIVEEPARAMPPGFTSEAMREAEKLGAELKDLNLPKTKTGQTLINAPALIRAIRLHHARPIAEAAEDRIPHARIDFAAGEVILDGSLWLSSTHRIDPEELRKDATLMTEFIESYSTFFGDAWGAVDHYWAFLVWLYSAPAAPYLRQAAIPAGIDPWIYPVYAVLYGRSSGGKTLFTRVAARSMFGFEKMIRSGVFTAVRALGLRDRLGSIPLLVDDVTRDKFTEHVASLVRTDQDISDCYAPVVITTNKDVTAIPVDISKRMMTCHIDAAIPENKSVAGQVARKIAREIGSALYRAYLLRMLPKVRGMRASIDEGQPGFPDLLTASSETLREIFEETLGAAPQWARKFSFDDNFGIRHRKFSEQLVQILADADDRTTVNRKTGEVSINFGGDVNQAAQFAKGVPDFVLKGRFADIVKLDLAAIEKEMGVSVDGRGGFWRRLLRGR